MFIEKNRKKRRNNSSRLKRSENPGCPGSRIFLTTYFFLYTGDTSGIRKSKNNVSPNPPLTGIDDGSSELYA